jgi:Patatin-like phospholipase
MDNEARDLARAFALMLRAATLQQGKRDGAPLIDVLKAPAKGALDNCPAGPTADWTPVAGELENKFRDNPELPAKLWELAEEWDGSDWPRPFPLVKRDELKQIAERRRITGAPDTSPDVVGLAFSGGGIRSATFNLGVLQGLAEFGILPRVDYLSTVSGGGYIGAWFAAWMQRKKFDPAAIESRLSPTAERDPNAESQKPLRFLRQFSNYLTPTVGLLSFDTWTMAAVYLRNVTLNQITLVAAFSALLILPRMFGALINFESTFSPPCDLVLTGIAAALLVCSVYFVSTYLYSVTVEASEARKRQVEPAASPPPESTLESILKTLFGPPPYIQLLCVWPLLIAVSIASPLFWKHSRAVPFQSLVNRCFTPAALAFFAFLSLVITFRGGFFQCFVRRLKYWTGQLYVVLALVTALVAITGTCLLYGYILLIQYFSHREGSGIWHATVWGPPALLAVISLTAILQMGLMGVDFPDAGREWLSRFRAVTNIYTFFWLALFCASIYGPLLIAKLNVWVTGLGTAWIATTLASVLAGNSARSGQTKEGDPVVSKLDLVAKIGPPVFLVGFVLLVSLGVHLLLAHAVLTDPGQIKGFFRTLDEQHWNILNGPLDDCSKLFNGGDWFIAAPVTLFVLFAAAALILVWRVDINEFSMHHFYKNRLVRCYLGASNPERKPDPFTGFDNDDDFSIAELRPDTPGNPYRGPYHIVNATLNLSAGGQLAWQERQAASFVFTPCYSGFHLQADSDHPGELPRDENLKFCAYRKTTEYAYKGGIHLGTAIAISGAAADPNQGFNTSPAVAFLMTVFDVRLGWWLGNPRKDRESKLSSPRFGLGALVSELFGRTDNRANFVSLSDGGHFDNMGIYELVRRGCKYIVLCDAEQDGAYTFGGLGMAIRKCRIDFGAEIDIDPRRIVPLAATRRSDAHCAVGKIAYADGSKGVLVYIKSSLTGNEPEDVLQYAASKPAFPHETTGDQWFTESQFESYRKLGYKAAKSTFEPANAFIEGGWDPARTETSALFEALADHWSPVNPALREHATKHTKTLNDLFDKIRASDSLQALGSQLFPGGTFQPKQSDPAAEFFFCMTLIQLVEDVYFDFQLDRPEWRNDPRIAGWTTIFRRWRYVPAMDSTWNAGKETFRKDFQHFWDNLERIPPKAQGLARPISNQSENRWPF